MITLGIDAHKRAHTHTVVAVDVLGRRLGCRTTCGTTTADHQALIVWAGRFGAERTWKRWCQCLAARTLPAAASPRHPCPHRLERIVASCPATSLTAHAETVPAPTRKWRTSRTALGRLPQRVRSA